MQWERTRKGISIVIEAGTSYLVEGLTPNTDEWAMVFEVTPGGAKTTIRDRYSKLRVRQMDKSGKFVTIQEADLAPKQEKDDTNE